MSSNLDALLTKGKRRVKGEPSSGKKIMLSVAPEIHATFKRACTANGVKMSKCLEAMMRDFIQSQAFKPEVLSKLTFRGEASSTTPKSMPTTRVNGGEAKDS